MIKIKVTHAMIVKAVNEESAKPRKIGDIVEVTDGDAHYLVGGLKRATLDLKWEPPKVEKPEKTEKKSVSLTSKERI